MAKTGYIYKITSPTNKIYVGKTVNLSTRKSYYRSNNNKSQKIIYNSIDKYGWDNHIFEVIDTTSIDSLNELEVKYIKELNLNYSSMLKTLKNKNKTSGGFIWEYKISWE